MKQVQGMVQKGLKGELFFSVIPNLVRDLDFDFEGFGF
jgi:hypothetical protein